MVIKGNNSIRLKDFHLFSSENNYYLLNIDNMVYFKIDEDLYSNLQKEDFLHRKNNSSFYTFLSLLSLIDEAEKEGKENLRKFPSSLPVSSIMLNVTQTCNMSCSYCYGIDGEYGNKGHMSSATAFKSVDWLLKLSGKIKSTHITFFGGEPFLNFPLIKEIVSYGKKEAKKLNKNIKFAIITNGTILNDEIVFFIQKNGIDVTVSFDGFEETQNKNRPFKDGRGSYQTVRKNIAKLIYSGIKRIGIKTIISDENTDFVELKEALQVMGCKYFDFHLPSPVMIKKDMENELSIFQISKSESLEKLQKKVLDYLEVEALQLLNNVKERKDFSSKIYSSILRQLITGRKKEYYCGAGKGLLNISISGDIYPCHRFNGIEKMKMGNISDYRPDFQKDYISLHTSNISECTNCWARFFCGGGCIYDSLEFNGNLKEPYKFWCESLCRSVEFGILIYDRMDDGDKKFFIENCNFRGNKHKLL